MPRRAGRSRPSLLAPSAIALDQRIADDGVWRLERGHLVSTGEPVAVRLPSLASPRAGALLSAEHRLLRLVGGGPLPDPVGLQVDVDETPTALVWRPAPAMALADRRLDGPTLTVDQVTAVVADIADGLANLHGAGYVHHGVGLGAIVVADDGRVVLADLGSVCHRGTQGADPSDDVLALGRLGLDLLEGIDPPGRDLAAEQAVRAVLARLVDPDPLRRADARTAATVLRRSGPSGRLLWLPVDSEHRAAPARRPNGSLPLPHAAARSSTDRRATGEAEVATSIPTATSAVGPTVGPGGVGPLTDVGTDTDSPTDVRADVDADAAAHAHSRRHPTETAGPGESIRALLAPARRPSPPSRPLGPIVLGGIAVGLLVAGIGRLQAPRPPDDATPTPCPLAGAPAAPADGGTVQADVDGRGCTVPVQWSAERGEVLVTSPEGVRRYGLGQPGDELLVADWDCDGDATPVLRRPGEGRAWRFEAWPTDERPATPVEIPDDVEPPRC